MTPTPRQQEPADLAGSAAEQAAAFVRRQGQKLAETQARQHHQKEAAARATPPVSAVSARTSRVRHAARCGATPAPWADLPRQRAKEKAITAKTAPRDIRGVSQGRRRLRTAANETVRSVTTQAQIQTHAQKIRLAAQRLRAAQAKRLWRCARQFETFLPICTALQRFLRRAQALP